MPDFFLGSGFRPTTLVELLRWRALHQAQSQAYVFLTDEDVDSPDSTNTTAAQSYGEIDKHARAIAAWLQAAGLGRERALLLYPPGLDFIRALFGCLYAGGTAIPVAPPQTLPSLQTLQAIAQNAQASLILTSAALRARIEPLLSLSPVLQQLRWVNTDSIGDGLADEWMETEVRPDALALLQYTSGTTGIPKGVMLTHENLTYHAELIARTYKGSDDTRFLSWIPIYHNSGLFGGVIQPLFSGFPSYLMSPLSFLQSPPRWLRAISKYRATLSGGPNFAFDLCSRHASPELLESLDLSSWDTAFNASEQIRADTLNRFAEIFRACGFRREAFYPIYALTEASLIVSCGFTQTTKTVLSAALAENSVVDAAPVEAQAKTLVSCGTLMPEQRVAVVVPETLKECLPGHIGEIWVSGRSVAQGYWNLPEQTEHTFRAYLSETGEGPFLRTGDLGFLHENELFITGRIKELIIIRGRNHYATDIEATTGQSHPLIRPGCGAAFSIDADDEEQLVVVQEVWNRESLPFDNIVSAIRQEVAQQHGIEVHAVVLLKEATIPRTGSNKIQRPACRTGFLAGTLESLHSWQRDEKAIGETPAAPDLDAEGAIVRPIEAIERWLARWLASKLGLGIEQVTTTQTLASLSLDSLTAIELSHAIESAFHISFPMWQLLQCSGLDRLAEQILEYRERKDLSTLSPLHSDESVSGEYPLSLGQQSLWFLYQMNPASAAYHISGAVRIPGALDVEALRRAFERLVARHDSWRTTFNASRDEPRQQVHEQMEVRLAEEDATGWSDEFLRARLSELARLPFDLAKGPLFRLLLFRRSADEYVLLYVTHHIIGDLWSLSVLADELRVLYAAEKAGGEARLTPPRLRYTDFVRWQRQMLESAQGERLWNYWHERLAGELPVLTMPTDRPRPPMQTFRGATHAFALDSELTEKLKRLSRDYGATLYMTILAGFQVLLHRYSGQEDLIVGSPTTGRSLAEFADIVGYFVNPLPMRANLSGDPRFVEFLGQVRQTVLDAFKHQDYPFTLLVEKLQPERDPSRTPLFQVGFVFQKPHKLNEQGLAAFAVDEAGARLNLGELVLEWLPLERRGSQFDLSLVMSEVDGKLKAYCEYSTDLFEPETVARLCTSLQILLDAAVDDPQQHISSLPLLSAQERRRLLAGWEETEAEGGLPTCLHELFEAQVERTPEATALVFENERLSYLELNRRSNRLARHLRGLGVGAEARVAILMERSTEMVVAVLAVLKAGGAYLPLDPGYPPERLSFMLSDARAKVLLTMEQTDYLLPELEWEILRLRLDEKVAVSEQDEANLQTSVHTDNLAYVIYTSGSTGTPKGVMVSHRAIVNHMQWMQASFPLSETDCVLQKTPFSFDASIWEFYAPLLAGARLAMARPGAHQDPQALVQALREHQVTVLQLVPSLLQVLLEEEGLADCRRLKRVFCGGEPLPRSMQERFFSLLDAQLVNLYGPTEACIDATSMLCRRDDEYRNPPIGQPIARTQVYLLDGNMQPVPPGVPGEIYIGGTALARGYLAREELTAEKFIPHPFSSAPGQRLYRTGDVGRYLTDANIEYVGRIDAQVKLRGFRIEPGEIEALLNRHPSVRACAVMVREDTRGDRQLVAYVVTGGESNAAELRRHLKERLPDYMLPQAFVQLDRLPLTASGKLDRGALPAPDTGRTAQAAEFLAPRTEVERVVSEIWIELLGVERISVFDDFFELRGHSLLATQMMSRVRSALDVELPVSAFFESPTIAGLSERIETARRSEADPKMALLLRKQSTGFDSSPLVAIQTGGSKQTFFCVHPVSGNVLSYFLLARYLGHERPFYGLQSAGLYGEREPLNSIEEMAAYYIEAIIEVQPDGPYLLGGWSLGGVVALEMAQQLQRRGREVSLVVLIDSQSPHLNEGRSDVDAEQENSLLAGFIQDLCGLYGTELPISLDSLRQMDADSLLNYVLEQAKQLDLLPAETGLVQLSSFIRVFKSNRQALRTYLPADYRGKVLLLRAGDVAAQGAPRSDLGWKRIATQVEIQEIPGDHYSIILEPHVQALAQHLKAYLDGE